MMQGKGWLRLDSMDLSHHDTKVEQESLEYEDRESTNSG